ncbi:MAG: hypothetical protein RML39_03970 [Oscillatoriaceae cyanobacterium SKYGB_i_bin93]|nr:hypothetical protein [Oscillatoriaceae cyanobacterium SKYGB_i_bin93]
MKTTYEIRTQSINHPAQYLLIKNVSWQMFEKILDELGENRAASLFYNKGTLEIMTPLPEHEVDKKIISNLVEILLEELNILEFGFYYI